jgi:hypothetical protein
MAPEAAPVTPPTITPVTVPAAGISTVPPVPPAIAPSTKYNLLLIIFIPFQHTTVQSDSGCKVKNYFLFSDDLIRQNFPDFAAKFPANLDRNHLFIPNSAKVR